MRRGPVTPARSSTRSGAASGSPLEELEATLAAIDVERPERVLVPRRDARPRRGARRRRVEAVRRRARGIKELEPVVGWPRPKASLVFRDRVATTTSTVVERLLDAGGAVPVGLTTASEFGGLNVSVTKLNGVTHNPWRHGRTVGGSSAGSAAAVAGGLVTPRDRRRRRRLDPHPRRLHRPARDEGHVRPDPRGPARVLRPNTVVLGNLARSVRDAARYYDVCAGYDPADPSSLPAAGGWEAGLGTHDLARPARRGHPRARRRHRVDAGGRGTCARGRRGAHRRDRHDRGRPAARAPEPRRAVDDGQPRDAARRARRPLAAVRARPHRRGRVRPATCRSRSTTCAPPRSPRSCALQANEAMAAAFDEVDFVIAATNPGPAFPADAPTSNPQEGVDRRRRCPERSGATRSAARSPRCAVAASRSRACRRRSST